MRRFRRVLIATAASLSAFGAYTEVSFAARPAAPAPSTPLAEFAEIGTVPGAASQPTTTGRRIASLQEWNGKVYAGYGDWGANTGPIEVASTTTTGSGFAAEYVLDTEAVEVIRPIGDRLVIPHTDPRSGASDFAFGTPWDQRSGLGATHVFDATTLTGDDLWFVGSRGNQAIAWRSTDDGSSWTDALVVDPTDPTSFARFQWVAVVGGRLYVQPWTGSSGNDNRSYVFDGTTWSRGKPLLDRYQSGRRPTAFNGSTIYATSDVGWAGSLRSFDGRRVITVRENIVDFAVAGGRAFALGADDVIVVSTDLKSWTPVARAPAGGVSLASSGNQLWVGTESSSVWRASLNA